MNGKWKQLESEKKEMTLFDKPVSKTIEVTFDNTDEVFYYSFKPNRYSSSLVAGIYCKEDNIDYVLANVADSEDFISPAYGAFKWIKKILEEKNNLGWLSIFAKLVVNDSANCTIEKFHQIYSLLSVNKDKLAELGGAMVDKRYSGDSKSLLAEVQMGLNIGKQSILVTALEKLDIQRQANQFIKAEFPRLQRQLIEDKLNSISRRRYSSDDYVEDLRGSVSNFNEFILTIKKDASRTNILKKRIPTCKTADEILDLIISLKKPLVWDYDYWLEKLENTKDVKITWRSNADKQIIILVQDFEVMREVAFMTSWCILKRDSYKSYSDGTNQFIFYNFNKPASDKNCVIGFTLNRPGKIGYRSHSSKNSITHCKDKFDKDTTLPSNFYAFSFRKNKSIKKRFIT